MLRKLIILCCLSWLPFSRGAEWVPAAEAEGYAYQSVEELRSFYKLSTGVQAAHKGAHALGLGDTRLELGPGKREMHIGGILLKLSRPLLKDASGGLLLSREDWVKWVDPILRPTYIEGRMPVRTVVLDPGHGGHDDGYSGSGAREADTTLRIALRLKAELEKAGLQVVLTRSGDYTMSDQQRVDIANAAQDAIFLSLHLNTGRSDFRGARVYTLAPAAPGEQARPGNARDGQHAALAYALQSALVRQAGALDGGCQRAHFCLLSSVSCPAAWVELGYATHEQEGPALASPAYQETLALALAQGIATYAAATSPAAQIPTQAPPPKAVATHTPPATLKKPSPAEPSKSSAKKATATGSRKSAADSSSRERTRSRRTRR